MKFGLSNETIEKLKNVFQKHSNLNKVLLYGSRAMGNYKNGSDIDLVISGDELDLSTLNKIADEIDDLMLPYFVDITIFEKITNHDLIEHIKRNGKLFYMK